MGCLGGGGWTHVFSVCLLFPVSFPRPPRGRLRGRVRPAAVSGVVVRDVVPAKESSRGGQIFLGARSGRKK